MDTGQSLAEPPPVWLVLKVSAATNTFNGAAWQETSVDTYVYCCVGAGGSARWQQCL